MNLSHGSDTPFEKPKSGQRYTSHEHGWVAVTDYKINRVEKYEDEPDSALFGIGIEGVGMGGESLIRTRVIPWHEYQKLSSELKEAAISSTECVVQPPGKWRLAIKSGLAGFIWPEQHSSASLMFQYPDQLWEIDEYHKVAQDARIVANIPDGNLDDLFDTVAFEEPKAGEIYINSHGDACIYSKISNNVDLGCTRYKISKMKPVVVDVDNTYILPVSEQDHFNKEELGDLEWNHSNVFVQTFGDMGFHRRSQIIFDTIIDPESVTARLGKRQEWMNFGLPTDQDSLISKIGGERLGIDQRVVDELEGVEMKKRRDFNDKIDEYKNSLVDSIREFTRNNDI